MMEMHLCKNFTIHTTIWMVNYTSYGFVLWPRYEEEPRIELGETTILTYLSSVVATRIRIFVVDSESTHWKGQMGQIDATSRLVLALSP